MKMLKKSLCVLLCLLFAVSFVVPAFAANEKSQGAATSVSSDETNEKVISFINPNGRVLSVAKYGNVRVYPANSIEGIVNAVDLGIDIVTCSVQLTKDNQFVLLCSNDLSKQCVSKGDGTIVAGKVSDYTLDDLKANFCLKSGYGGTDAKPTEYGVASLIDAISAVDGKAMLMINNGFKYADEINKIAVEKDATNEIILRGAKDTEEINAFTSANGTSACFVAAYYNDDNQKGASKNFVSDALDAGAFVVELGAEKSLSTIFKSSTLSKFGSSGRAFVSTTKENLCGGREDRQADWSDLIERGYSMIETDYPRELANYLKEIETYRTELTTLINDAEAIDKEIYTKDSLEVLNDSLEEAKAVSSKGCIALDEIDTARYHIQESLDGLVLKTGDEKNTLPTWLIIVIILVSILLLGAVYVFGMRAINKARKKKRNFERFKRTFKSEIPVENDESLMTNIAEDEESNRGLTEDDIVLEDTLEEPNMAEGTDIDEFEDSKVELLESEEDTALEQKESVEEDLEDSKEIVEIKIVEEESLEKTEE